jgi:hypothetical protein
MDNFKKGKEKESLEMREQIEKLNFELKESTMKLALTSDRLQKLEKDHKEALDSNEMSMKDYYDLK